MRRWLGILVVTWIAAGGLANADILTLFSDGGPSINQSTNTYDAYAGQSHIAGWNGKATDTPSKPEGYQSWKTTSTVNTYAGWDFRYWDPTNHSNSIPQDLSRFNNGELRFWVQSNVDLKIEVQDSNPGGDRVDVMISQYGWSAAKASQWMLIRIPFAPLLIFDSQHGGTGSLNFITAPFVVTALTGPAQFYIDDVRYVDSTSVPNFSVGLFNRSDNSPAQSIDWGNLSLNTNGGWVTAPQYLKFSVDSDIFPWGVQIYTDNTAADANPKFATSVPSGDPGSNPAGLVQVGAPNMTLPIAWSVKADTTAAPSAADPNNENDPNFYQWFYMQDRATPAIPKANTSAFQDGANVVTVRNNVGIQFAQGKPEDFNFDNTVGAVPPPNVIYFESFLGGAISPNTYKTTTLRIEFYYP